MAKASNLLKIVFFEHETAENLLVPEELSWNYLFVCLHGGHDQVWHCCVLLFSNLFSIYENFFVKCKC
jgi:hypothetical protein